MLFFSSPVFYSFSLLISLSFIYLLAPQILQSQDKPIKLHDDINDGLLLKKAVLSPKKISHLSSTSKPKIAFLFLTNSPLTFAPLWEKFFRGNSHLYNIYVHADPFSGVPNPGGVFENQFIPSKKTERGSASLISAERRLIARAILDDDLNLYFALVSQHCIPIHSFKYFYKSMFRKVAFSSSIRTSFIEILSEDPNLPDRYDARGEHAMLPEVPFEEFRVGSQFFVLAKRHALRVLEDKKLWRKFKLPCLNIDSCYPEEHYFPTLLSMVDRKGCSGYTLTHVNWTNSFDGHPYLYHADEIDAQLVHKLRRSNSSYSYVFARKFSPDCLQPLMCIADDVIFRD